MRLRPSSERRVDAPQQRGKEEGAAEQKKEVGPKPVIGKPFIRCLGPHFFAGGVGAARRSIDRVTRSAWYRDVIRTVDDLDCSAVNLLVGRRCPTRKHCD